MIFTDYVWPCCSHVHQPRHARARRPSEGYACCENKATAAALCSDAELRPLLRHKENVSLWLRRYLAEMRFEQRPVGVDFFFSSII